MQQLVRFAILAACALVSAVAARGAVKEVVDPPSAGLSAQERSRGFTYDPSVTAYDRQMIDTAIAGADPLAQRLIAQVDGITTLRVGQPPGGAAGVAEGNPDAFTVTLDLKSVSTHLGQRGVNRLVLHELGHVVDFVLVPDAMKAELDRAVPTCLNGAQPGCDQQPERFAESFAKWAMGDIGVNLYIGYAVPPPANLETWAAPLAQLAE